MTTQEIHERINRRCGRVVSGKHLQILIHCFGRKIDETNIADFERYAY